MRWRRANAQLKGCAGSPNPYSPLRVWTLVNPFDGAAIHGAVRPHPDIDEQRIALLAGLLDNAYG